MKIEQRHNHGLRPSFRTVVETHAPSWFAGAVLGAFLCGFSVHYELQHSGGIRMVTEVEYQRMLATIESLRAQVLDEEELIAVLKHKEKPSRPRGAAAAHHSNSAGGEQDLPLKEAPSSAPGT